MMKRFLTIYILIIFTLVSCSFFRKKEKIYYDDGSLKFEVPLKNGQREGKSKEYYQDGSLRAVQKWKDGKAHGLCIHYFDNGDVYSRAYWKNGLAHGKMVEFYKNGEVKYQFNYYMGKAHGKQKIYYENGNLKEIRYFDKDQLYDFERFDKSGGLDTDEKKAVVYMNKDTFLLGEKVILTAHLGNNIGRTNIIVGKYFAEDTLGVVEDVIGEVEPVLPGMDDSCRLVFEARELGKNQILGFVHDNYESAESIVTEGYPFVKYITVVDDTLNHQDNLIQ